MDFKEFMSRVPNCVAVITYARDGVFGACTISSFISVDITLGSETALFVLKKHSRTGSVISEGKEFIVNFLNNTQKELARNAGSHLSQSEIDSLINSHIDETNKDFPVLKEVVSYCKLTVSKEIEIGESIIYLCKVLDSHVNQQMKESPLVYFAREFTSLSND